MLLFFCVDLQYDDLGCFIDQEQRAFNGEFFNRNGMTVEMCAELCADKYEYFGVQATDWVRFCVCVCSVQKAKEEHYTLRWLACDIWVCFCVRNLL